MLPKRILLLAFGFLLIGSVSAAPLIGNFVGVGGLTLPSGNVGGTATTGRVPLLNPASNISNVRNTLGLTGSALSGLPGATYTHASALYSDVSITLGQDIFFTALSNPAPGFAVGSPAGPPIFNYFVSLDPTGPTAGLVRALALTNSARQFSLEQLFGPIASGTYRIGFGAVRTNPGNTGFGHLVSSYGTNITLSNVFGTPEMDPASATTPVALLLGVVCLVGERVTRRPSTSRC